MSKNKPSSDKKIEDAEAMKSLKNDIFDLYGIRDVENIDPNKTILGKKSVPTKAERHFEAFMEGDSNPEETEKNKAAKQIQSVVRGKMARKSLPELKATKKERDEIRKAFDIPEVTYDARAKRSLSETALAELEEVKKGYEAYERGESGSKPIAQKTTKSDRGRSF